MRFQAPESLSEQIAQHIGQQIISGAMPPGQRIQELKVAGELDVSRGSVREALLILERRHLINIYPRKGAVVAPLTPELINNLYDIYVNLLVLLVETVVQRSTPDSLEPMLDRVRRLQNRIRSEDVTSREVIESGFEVMNSSYPVIQNPYLEETLENFRPAVSRTYYLALERYREERATTEKYFVSLAESVLHKDAEAAKTLTREFGERQREIVLQALENDNTLSADESSS